MMLVRTRPVVAEMNLLPAIVDSLQNIMTSMEGDIVHHDDRPFRQYRDQTFCQPGQEDSIVYVAVKKSFADNGDIQQAPITFVLHRAVRFFRAKQHRPDGE